MTTQRAVGNRVEVLRAQVPEGWFAEDPESARRGNAWLDDPAAHLAGGGSVTFGLAGDEPETTSTELIVRAKVTMAAVTELLKERHALPADAYVEVDEESYGTPTAPEGRSRFLLPHQDGAHSSFLTPRAANDEHGITATRVFSNTVYFKRPSHKMYQGFLITHPGSFPGETYYYDLIAMLYDAYLRSTGRPAHDVKELEGFLGDNIARSLALAEVHRSRYLTIGSLLGSDHPAHHVLPSGPRAESELWPEQYASIPDIWRLVEACPCGACDGPGSRLICHGFMATLGLTWPQARARYEAAVTGDRGDLLIGNNLTQKHAAFSARDRQICPICVVVDTPIGPEYEAWLEEQWTQGFNRVGGMQ